MLKIFGKKDSSPSRRTMRFWMMRVKKAVTVAALTGLLGWGVYYGWSHHLSGQVGPWLEGKAIAASHRMGFKVNDILVVGRSRLPQEELLSRLKIEKGAPIFAVSIGETQGALADIPWVSKVIVSRRLPDRVVIDITERTPAALWQYNKKVVAIDAEGKALTGESLERWGDLPLLVGEDAPAHTAEILGLLNAQPAIAAELEAAIRMGSRRWDLLLRNGMRIKLPETGAELALAKVALYQEREQILSKDLSAIDLRIQDKFVVEPKAATAPDKQS